MTTRSLTKITGTGLAGIISLVGIASIATNMHVGVGLVPGALVFFSSLALTLVGAVAIAQIWKWL